MLCTDRINMPVLLHLIQLHHLETRGRAQRQASWSIPSFWMFSWTFSFISFPRSFLSSCLIRGSPRFGFRCSLRHSECHDTIRYLWSPKGDISRNFGFGSTYYRSQWRFLSNLLIRTEEKGEKMSALEFEIKNEEFIV